MTGASPQLATFAADLFRTRQRRAAASFARAQVGRADATAALRPWLAIACLAGADLPELVEPLAQLRTVQRFPGGQLGQCTDGEARSLLASDLCPPLQWAAVLAAARDKAIDALDRVQPDPAAITHTRQLIALCAALQVTTPYIPREYARPVSAAA